MISYYQGLNKGINGGVITYPPLAPSLTLLKEEATGIIIPDPPIYDLPELNLYKATATNAASPLTIPTYEGSGQAIHPGVVYFENGWNGWKYWMSMTPYPNSNDNYENPSIVVSNNGIDWQVPAGLTNPIEPAPVNFFNADSELTYGFDDKLHCTFAGQETTGFATWITRHSSDGVDWSDWTATTSKLGTGRKIVSPATIQEDDGTWTMFAINTTTKYIDKYKADKITDVFQFDRSGAVHSEFGFVPWHFDVSKYGNKYHAIISGGSMAFAESEDGFTWNAGRKPILETTASGWDSNKMYRASMIFFETPYPHYKVWYSAMSDAGVWGTGYTEITFGL